MLFFLRYSEGKSAIAKLFINELEKEKIMTGDSKCQKHHLYYAMGLLSCDILIEQKDL